MFQALASLGYTFPKLSLIWLTTRSTPPQETF
jgi:hypothetical protein